MRFLAAILSALLLCCGAAHEAAAQKPCPQVTAPKISPDATYTVDTIDYCWFVSLTNPGVVTVQLPAPGLIFFPGFTTTILPLKGATLDFVSLADDSGQYHQINGQNGQTGIALEPGQGAILKVQEDRNWYVLPAGNSSVSVSQQVCTGPGGTDIGPTVQALLNAGVKNVTLPVGCVIASNVTIPSGETLTATDPWAGGLRWTPGAGGLQNTDYPATANILLSQSATISSGGPSAALTGLRIVRAGLVTPTTMREYLTQVGRFAGTAITCRHADFRVANVFLVGFQYPLYATDTSAGVQCDRLNTENVAGDNTNGITFAKTGTYSSANASADTPKLINSHFWPFLGYQQAFGGAERISVVGAASNGSGVIRLQITPPAGGAFAPALATGDVVAVSQVAGVDATCSGTVVNTSATLTIQSCYAGTLHVNDILTALAGIPAGTTISNIGTCASGPFPATCTMSAAATADVALAQTVTARLPGTSEANGRWTVSAIDSTHVDLQGSTFTNAYAPRFSGTASITGTQMLVTAVSSGSINGGLVLGDSAGHVTSGTYVASFDIGTQTTNNTTASGNATLHFASVPSWITAGMGVVDQTTGASIPSSTTVLSTTATTVVMSKNAAGAGVGSGDTIGFAAVGGTGYYTVSNSQTVTSQTIIGGGQIYLDAARRSGAAFSATNAPTNILVTNFFSYDYDTGMSVGPGASFLTCTSCSNDSDSQGEDPTPVQLSITGGGGNTFTNSGFGGSGVGVYLNPNSLLQTTASFTNGQLSGGTHIIDNEGGSITIGGGLLFPFSYFDRQTPGIYMGTAASTTCVSGAMPITSAIAIDGPGVSNLSCPSALGNVNAVAPVGGFSGFYMTNGESGAATASLSTDQSRLVTYLDFNKQMLFRDSSTSYATKLDYGLTHGTAWTFPMGADNRLYLNTDAGGIGGLAIQNNGTTRSGLLTDHTGGATYFDVYRFLITRDSNNAFATLFDNSTNAGFFTFATGIQVGFAGGAPKHLTSGQLTAPALTSCGTSPAIVGTDIAGEVTMGTGAPTGCVITFNAAYTGAPFCTVTWQGTPLATQTYAISTTAITTTQTATSSNKLDYHCIGRAGG